MPTKTAKPAKKAAGKQSRASVVKRTFSIPKPLFTHATKKAKAQAKAAGQPKGNVSGYISGLIAADKARDDMAPASTN